MRAVLLALCVAAAAAPAAAEPLLPEVEALAAPLVGVDTPGLAILVMRDGEVLHRAGYGLADVESGAPTTPRTIFDLASVSKQMTGLAAALVVVDGRLDPDGPIAETLDVLPLLAEGASRPITPRHLAVHTSGLPDYLGGDDALAFDETTTNDEVLAWLAEQPLLAEPGTEFSYSNSGYLALGSLVAAADGRDGLEAVLADRVWKPLGMRDSAIARAVDPARRATGYAGTGGDFEESAWDTAVEGDGSVFTTLDDLALYEAALAQGLFGEEAEALLFGAGLLDDGSPIDDGLGAGYGWGWGLAEDADGNRVAAHDGSWWGTATAYRRNLDTGLSVIVLANGEDFDALGLAEEIGTMLDR